MAESNLFDKYVNNMVCYYSRDKLLEVIGSYRKFHPDMKTRLIESGVLSDNSQGSDQTEEIELIKEALCVLFPSDYKKREPDYMNILRQMKDKFKIVGEKAGKALVDAGTKAGEALVDAGRGAMRKSGKLKGYLTERYDSHRTKQSTNAKKRNIEKQYQDYVLGIIEIIQENTSGP